MSTSVLFTNHTNIPDGVYEVDGDIAPEASGTSSAPSGAGTRPVPSPVPPEKRTGHPTAPQPGWEKLRPAYAQLMAGALPGLMAQMPISGDSTVHWREYVASLASRAAQIADACVQAGAIVGVNGEVDWGDIRFGTLPQRNEYAPAPPPTRRTIGSIGSCNGCGANAWRDYGPALLACAVCSNVASRFGASGAQDAPAPVPGNA